MDHLFWPMAEAPTPAKRATQNETREFGTRVLWAVVVGPNVRHERWTKGREAAFGTSARWRVRAHRTGLKANDCLAVIFCGFPSCVTGAIPQLHDAKHGLKKRVL